jgi:hypothetical protein
MEINYGIKKKETMTKGLLKLSAYLDADVI